MKIYSLSSGSKANCTLVCEDNTNILIDFGLSVRSVKSKLKDINLTLEDINAIFITHEHSDHVKGLLTLLKYTNIPVYMSYPSYLQYIRGEGFTYRDIINVRDSGFSEEIGDIKIYSLSVPHDSNECLAYKIVTKNSSFGLCTDIGKPTKELLDFFTGCDYVTIESNHDIVMLECGSYPDELKRRILSSNGHLSNIDCAKTISYLLKNGTKKFMLAHISPENNTKDLAIMEVKKYLENENILDKLEKLLVADRENTIIFE